MKKIVVVGMVKNSADIIESFIRCNLVYASKFVLYENMSTDRTREILGCLIEEGYDIEILDDEENSYCQCDKRNNLIQYVVNKYDFDYVMPLDDDEILVSDNSEKSVSDIIT